MILFITVYGEDKFQVHCTVSMTVFTRYGLPLASFSQSSALQILVLRDNELIGIPPEVGSLHRLRELHIQGNRLTVLPPELGEREGRERERHTHTHTFTHIDTHTANLNLAEYCHCHSLYPCPSVCDVLLTSLKFHYITNGLDEARSF